MLALDEYYQRASLLRVVAVCVFTPFASILVATSTECVPLRPTAEGPTANFVFWTRHACMVTLILLGLGMQGKTWIPGSPLTLRRIVGMSCGCSFLATLLDVVVAKLWVFPIPFLVVLGVPALEVIIVVVLLSVVGRKELAAVKDGSFHLKKFMNLQSAQASLMLIYPAFHALFLAVPRGTMQRFLLLFLPVMNLALKNMVGKCGAHLEDCLPQEVVFTVDVFDALYTTMCMRTVTSLPMVSLVVLVRNAELLLSLLSMYTRSNLARGHCTIHQVARKSMANVLLDQPRATVRMLADAVLALLQSPVNLDPPGLRQIRLLSGIQLSISDSSTAILTRLAAHAVYNNERKGSQVSSMALPKAKYFSASMLQRSRSSSIQQPHESTTTVEVMPTATVMRFDLPEDKLNKVEKLDKWTVATETLGTEQLFRSKSVNSVPRYSTMPSIQREKATRELLTMTADLLPIRSPNSPSFQVLPSQQESVASTSISEARKHNTKIVNQTLQLLFNNEYLGLIAYTQCVIPVVYLIYMTALQHLPNREFYPPNVGSSALVADRMLVIGVLGLLQFVSLVVLHKLVAARFAVSSLYQIAFVLEMHASIIQFKLITWLVFSVGFQLEHYGADFSFQFAWIQSNSR